MPDLNTQDPHPSYVGIPTFAHAPLALSADELKQMGADIAIIGAPVDMGVVNRPGARFGPRAIRQADYLGGPNDYYYHMGLAVHPTRALKIVDFSEMLTARPALLSLAMRPSGRRLPKPWTPGRCPSSSAATTR